MLDWARQRRGAYGRLLDVGCGIGRFVGLARSAGWDAFGYDVSKAAIANCTPDVKEYCRAGSSPEECFGGDKFALITLWDVIEHAPDTQELLAAVVEALEPGGLLVIETPANEFVGRRMARWLDVASLGATALRRRLYYRGHLHYFSRASLHHLLCSHGLRVVMAERIHSNRQLAMRKYHRSRLNRALACAMFVAQSSHLVAGNKHLVVAEKAMAPM